MLLKLTAIAAVLLLGSLSLNSEHSLALAEDAAVSASAAPSAAATEFTDEQSAKLDKAREKFEFQAEVSRLMDIIINSLYTKVEIFLRELISNASDALDKIRFLSLSDPKALGTGDVAQLDIRVAGDKAARTLTITDKGVGMTKADLINYLGTVARSGTASLMEQLASGGDLNLIGQFGVGFYSVYLVADKVRVVTKHNDDKQYVWESAADGSYTIAEDPRGATLGRGTEITLFLKDDATDYADTDKLRGLIKRYSEFITFPIYLKTSHTEDAEVALTEDELAAEKAKRDEAKAAKKAEKEAAKAEAGEGEEEVKAEDEAEAEEEPLPTTRKEKREVVDWELVNDNKAIWARKPSEVKDEEYQGFYKAFTKDYADAHSWIHFKGEGEVEFRSILFTPQTAPTDLYDNYYSKSASLRLYVRKVLISDEFEDLLPRYLNFIKGVVDSDDLPLNVSREQLQQAKILKVVAKKLVRKALEMIRRLAQTEKKAWSDKLAGNSTEGAAVEDDEDGGKGKAFEIPSHLNATALTAYSKFWETFGKNIKLGVIEDSAHRSKLAKLLRFKSSASVAADKAGTGPAWRSLEDYVAAMKPGQKQIYFIAGESLEAVQASPFLERLTSAGLEVLYMTDPIDEYTVQNLPEFEGKRLQSITKEGLQLPEEDAARAKKLEEAYKSSFKPLAEYLKKVYGDKVEKVTVSSRLATTPAVLVTSQFGYSANMERIMRAQAFADPSKGAFMAARKTLEINPRHPIIAELKAKATADPEAGDESVKDLAMLLYDSALLSSGFPMDEPKDFAGRVYRLMKAGLSLPSLDLLPEMELPAAEEAEEAGGEEAGEDGPSVELLDDKEEL